MIEKREAVTEEQTIKCREMMRESVKEKQSCSLCHVHAAYDGSAGHRDRVKETESATESEDELL